MSTNHFCLPFTLKTCLISLKEAIIGWNPTLHMAIHERIKEVTQDGSELRGWYMYIIQVAFSDLTEQAVIFLELNFNTFIPKI